MKLFGASIVTIALTLAVAGVIWEEESPPAAQVTINSNDQMQYDIDKFTVQAGQPVKLTLKHTGSMPVAAMGHNVVILQQGEEVMAFGNAVMQQGGTLDNNYLPEPMRDRVIAHTEMIGGGESTTITFDAPQTPGEYPFLCTFPGHFATMKGIMVVE